MAGDRVLLLALLICGFVLFLLIPVLIAYARRHPERRTIARLSPFGVLSMILWVALIVWAASDKRNDAVIAKYVARLRERNLLPLVVGGLVAVGLLGVTATLLR